jgi:predicted  nucleic acid-binding Zn-ribbon protein
MIIYKGMDTELSPALERVAASVVETNRRRKQLEEELAAATAAVAALQHQSTSLELSMSELREQLEEALVARAHEDAALEQLTAERSKVLDRSDALRAQIEAALAEKTEAENALQTQIQAARRTLGSVESDIREVKTRFATVTDETARVQEALALVRQSADSAQAALADVSSKARDLDAATDGMAARVCRIAESIDQVERSHTQMAAASESLAKLSSKLEARKLEAESAADALLALSKDRQKSAAKISEHLAKLDELCVSSANGSNGSRDPAAAKPEPAPRAEPPRAPSPVRYEGTLATLTLLTSQSLLTGAEAQNAAELLAEGGVDKLVRSWWSRAMAGPAPGYYRLIIGEALAEANDAKGALTFFNRAMEGKPVDPFITYLVALALLRMKRYVDVLRIAQSLGRTKHGKALALNIEALHQSGGRRYDEAEAKLTQALATPGLAKLHYNETLYNLAALAAERGDVRAAAAWHEKLHTLDPAYRDVANHMQKKEVPVGAR